MLFYKVKKSVGDYGPLIPFELYTEKELEKMAARLRKDGLRLNMNCFEPVEVSKQKTYWSFGARFEINSNEHREIL